MGWKSLGKDAPRKGDLKRVEFIPRVKEKQGVYVQFPKELHEDLTDYCVEHHITHSALIRYLVSKEIGKWIRETERPEDRS